MARINEDGTVDVSYRVPCDDIGGTAWSGLYLTSTVAEVTAVLGPPGPGIGCGKTSVEWWIATPLGVATVYDYDEYEKPAADHPGGVYDFHLGVPVEGPREEIVGMVAALFAAHREEAQRVG